MADLTHALRIEFKGWPPCPLCAARIGQYGFKVGDDVLCLACARAAKETKKKKSK